jgi:hypothetical protein
MNDTVTPDSSSTPASAESKPVTFTKVAVGTAFVNAEGEVTKEGLHRMIAVAGANVNERSAFEFPNGHAVHVASRPNSRFLSVTDFTPNPAAKEGEPKFSEHTSVVKSDIIALAHVRSVAKRPALKVQAPAGDEPRTSA